MVPTFGKVSNMARVSKKKTQAAFDTMVDHLLTQKKRAGSGLDNGCYYRYSPNNSVTLKCAVGCLIPDSLYELSMEDQMVDSLLRIYPALAEHLKGVDEDLLYEVQRVHDNTMDGPEEWERKLKHVATYHNLKWNYEG